MLMHICNVGVGMTFSGGLIDMFLFGILQGNAKTNWIWIVIVGIVYFLVYYFLFALLIRKLDLKTPGRDDSTEAKLYTRVDVNARNQEKESDSKTDNEADAISAGILKGLGGRENSSDVDCCATRLRCSVLDKELVQDDLLKATGASGVIHKGNGVQIIYGPRVTVIKSNFEEYLERNPEKFVQKTGIEIASPITGMVVPVSQIPDEGFSSGAMGDGAGVTPTKNIIIAPADGEVSFVFDTKHAIGFITDSGLELLLHIGIDTVKLQGEGFTVYVENGQHLRKGEKMMELDLAYLNEHAPSLCSPVLCTNLEDNQQVQLLASGEVKAGEPLFVVL